MLGNERITFATVYAHVSSTLFGGLMSLGLGGILLLHNALHTENACNMTFMYRNLEFLPIDVAHTTVYPTGYQLLLYNEGLHYIGKKTLENNQIPVLFIPGSGGSPRQIRSIAAIVQNKTEMRHAPFRFRFFAVDFAEQLTFTSGYMLEKQQQYVMDALKTIRKLSHNKKKIVIMGHSFGGLVGMSLVNHEEYRYDWVDLFMLFSTPLQHSPIYMDVPSYTFQKKMRDSWLQKKELHRKVGVISYSGGLRDYLVPDGITQIPDIYHRPAWAIENVPDKGVDHLCILWCNQFARVYSRILYKYGERYISGVLNGQQVLDEYFDEEVEKVRKFTKLEVNGKKLRPHILTKVNKIEQFEIRNGDRMYFEFEVEPRRLPTFKIVSQCAQSIVMIRDGGLMHVKNVTGGTADIMFYRLNPDETAKFLVIAKTPNCKFTAGVLMPQTTMFWTWYEAVLTDLHLVATTFLICMLRFAMIEGESRIYKTRVLAMLTSTLITFAVAITLTDMVTPPYAAHVAGWIAALAYWYFVGFAVEVFSALFAVDLQFFVMTDVMLDNIYPFIAVLCVPMPVVTNAIFILLFAMQNGLISALLSIPLSMPLVLKISHAPFASFYFYEFRDIQHFFIGSTLLIYYICKTRNIDITYSPVNLILLASIPFEFFAHPVPLEIIAGFALLFLSFNRFIKDLSRRYLYLNLVLK